MVLPELSKVHLHTYYTVIIRTSLYTRLVMSWKNKYTQLFKYLNPHCHSLN